MPIAGILTFLPAPCAGAAVRAGPRETVRPSVGAGGPHRAQHMGGNVQSIGNQSYGIGNE